MYDVSKGVHWNFLPLHKSILPYTDINSWNKTRAKKNFKVWATINKVWILTKLGSRYCSLFLAI